MTWSFTAGSSSGIGLDDAGSMDLEATTAANIQLDAAMNNATGLALQLADVNKVSFLAITASRYDGSVKVKADGAGDTDLDGPLILFGEGVKLFAGDLSTLSVQNAHQTEAVTLSIVIGRKLSP